MAVATKEDKQSGLWDAVTENAALEELLDEHETAKVAARAYSRLHKKLKEQLSALKPQLQVDVRYRIGRFVVTPSMREGGDIAIPAWRKMGFGVKAID